MFKSTQTTVRYGEHGCRFKTIIEETCTVDQQTGEQKCQRLKRVFRKCPNDPHEVQIENEQVADSGAPSTIVQSDPYEGRAQDV